MLCMKRLVSSMACLGLFALSTLYSLPASASIVTYGDSAAFGAAVGSTTPVTISGLTASGTFTGFSSYTSNGVAIENVGGVVAVNNTWGMTGECLWPNGTYSTTLTFPSASTSATTAVGLLMAEQADNISFAGTVHFSNGTTHDFTVSYAAANTQVFYGIRSTDPAMAISSVVMAATSGEVHGPAFYGIEYATSSVPEPATCIMGLTTAIGLLAYAWRKRK